MSKILDTTTSQAEAFIQFQIQVKKKEIQDFKDEMCQLEYKKQKLTTLQEKLREEKKRHMCELNKETKEHERNLEQRQREDEEQVKRVTQENLEIQQEQEQEKQLEELRCKLARLQVQVEELKMERQELLQYKNEGSTKDHQKIVKLEKDIASTQMGFQELSEYFQRSLVAAVEETNQKEAQCIGNIHQLAFKRAIEKLDLSCKSKSEENILNKEEVSICMNKVTVLETTIQQLEEENLKHVDELFQMLHKDDPLISQDDEFLAQSASLGSHDTHSTDRNIMKISLEETSELVNRPPLAEAEGAQQERDGTTPSNPPDHGEMFSSQTNFTELTHLDLLEQRLLFVTGLMEEKAMQKNPLT